jgi:hypothetical protein
MGLDLFYRLKERESAMFEERQAADRPSAVYLITFYLSD